MVRDLSPAWILGFLDSKANVKSSRSSKICGFPRCVCIKPPHLQIRWTTAPVVLGKSSPLRSIDRSPPSSSKLLRHSLPPQHCSRQALAGSAHSRQKEPSQPIIKKSKDEIDQKRQKLPETGFNRNRTCPYRIKPPVGFCIISINLGVELGMRLTRSNS